MRIWLPPVLLTALLCALSAGMPALEPLFEWVQPDKRNVIYERESFLFLLQNHLTLVVISRPFHRWRFSPWLCPCSDLARRRFWWR
mgnify:CR=1 FL=1